MYIKTYEGFVLWTNFDENVKKELIRLGIKDEKELKKQVKLAKKGNLAHYLHDKKQGEFRFGMLSAIFKDAIEAKRITNFRIGTIKMVHRIAPMALAPFYPIAAILGYILGTSRAFNKVLAPILSDPGGDYSEFLKKFIMGTMKVAEGDIELKDRFSRAFVVSDGIVDMIKPEILQKFAIYSSEKMSKEDPNRVVPNNYIENELKSYLNDTYKIDPKIPLKLV